MTATDAMICTSCKKPKATLKQKKSKALPGVPMYLCQTCLDSKFEPRGFIVLAARAHGVDSVSYWVKGKRYLGDTISARELI